MHPDTHAGRSPSGRLRNFGAMSADKFLSVRNDVKVQANDGDALIAVEAEYERRWGWGPPFEVAGRSDHQFLGKDEWDRFYDTVRGADHGAQDYYCARCGSWAGNHRAEAPPMCPDTSGNGVGGYSPTDSFATQAWFDGTGPVSTEPQPLSALLEELLG